MENGALVWIDRDQNGVPEAMGMKGISGSEILLDEDGDGRPDRQVIENESLWIEKYDPHENVFSKIHVRQRGNGFHIDALFILNTDHSNYQLAHFTKTPYRKHFGASSSNAINFNDDILLPANRKAENSQGGLPRLSNGTLDSLNKKPRTQALPLSCALRENQTTAGLVKKWREIVKNIDEEAFAEDPLVKRLIHSNCNPQDGKIRRALSKIFGDSGSHAPRFFNCMSKLDGWKHKSNELVAKYLLLIRSADANQTPIIECHEKLPDGKVGFYAESERKIGLLKQWIASEIDPKTAATKIFHEMLHTDGTLSEYVIHNIETCCADEIKPDNGTNACNKAEQSVKLRNLSDHVGFRDWLNILTETDPELGGETASAIESFFKTLVGKIDCREGIVTADQCKANFRKAFKHANEVLIGRHCGPPKLTKQKCDSIASRLDEFIEAEVENCTSPEKLANCLIKHSDEFFWAPSPAGIIAAQRAQSKSKSPPHEVPAKNVGGAQTSNEVVIPKELGPQTSDTVIGAPIKEDSAIQESQIVVRQVIEEATDAMNSIGDAVLPAAHAASGSITPQSSDTITRFPKSVAGGFKFQPSRKNSQGYQVVELEGSHRQVTLVPLTIPPPATIPPVANDSLSVRSASARGAAGSNNSEPDGQLQPMNDVSGETMARAAARIKSERGKRVAPVRGPASSRTAAGGSAGGALRSGGGVGPAAPKTAARKARKPAIVPAATAGTENSTDTGWLNQLKVTSVTNRADVESLLKRAKQERQNPVTLAKKLEKRLINIGGRVRVDEIEYGSKEPDSFLVDWADIPGTQ